MGEPGDPFLGAWRCRSTRGGPALRSPTGCETRAPRSSSPTTSAPSASSRTSATAPASPRRPAPPSPTSAPAYVANPESVGNPISPVIELKIAAPDGSEVEPGEVGEIWLKGPTVVRGYFGLDEATAQAFTDGWFHTGDLGRLDAEGNLYVVDRLKDVIIRGGENIYAAEVEAALYEHPEITEAAIIGIPHDRLGEEVGAVVRA